MAALHHNGGQWHSHCRDAPAGRLYGIAAQCDTVGSMRRWRHCTTMVTNGIPIVETPRRGVSTALQRSAIRWDRCDGGGTAPQW
jgi:hypothetical protein